MPAGRVLCHAPLPQSVHAHATRSSRRSARVRALLAGAAVLAGAGMLAALHVLPASRGLDPISEPLSQYAFTPDAWLFDVAVLSLALGSAALSSALVRSGCLGNRSPARVLLAACSLSLVLVVVFRDHTPSGAVRTAGRIHWIAAMLAFGGLSLAPVLVGRHRTAACAQLTALARRLSIVTGPCFAVALAVSLVRYETPLPLPAWTFGLAERVLVVSQFAVAGVLTVWAWRGCTCPVDHPVREPERLIA